MRKGIGTISAVALAAVWLTSCTLMLDTEQQQCSTASDCGEFNGAPIYECVQNLCAPVSCAADAECSSRGSFVCENAACAPAECMADVQCQADSGKSCIAGRCVDPAFYCFDDRLSTSAEEPAVLKMSLFGFTDKLPPRELKTKVCVTQDTVCNVPVPAQSDYDSTTGLLTIRGLQNGQRYSIRWIGTGADGSQFIETEYLMMRPVVGTTVEAEPFELVTPELVSVLALTAGTEWMPNKGLMLSTVFGCDGKTLAGASLLDNRSATLYFLTGTSDVTATETDSTGRVGFTNMELGAEGAPIAHRITLTHKGRALYAITMTPRPNVITYIFFTMQDYGLTSDRTVLGAP